MRRFIKRWLGFVDIQDLDDILRPIIRELDEQLDVLRPADD